MGLIGKLKEIGQRYHELAELERSGKGVVTRASSDVPARRLSVSSEPDWSFLEAEASKLGKRVNLDQGYEEPLPDNQEKGSSVMGDREVKPEPAVTTQSKEVAPTPLPSPPTTAGGTKIPAGGLLGAGAPLLGGDSVAAQVGKSVDALSTTRSEVVALRHSVLASEQPVYIANLRALIAACYCEGALFSPKVWADVNRDPHGFSLENPHVYEDEAIGVGVFADVWLRSYLGGTVGVDGRGRKDGVEIIKPFGSNESSQGVLDKLKGSIPIIGSSK